MLSWFMAKLGLTPPFVESRPRGRINKDGLLPLDRATRAPWDLNSVVLYLLSLVLQTSMSMKQRSSATKAEKTLQDSGNDAGSTSKAGPDEHVVERSPRYATLSADNKSMKLGAVPPLTTIKWKANALTGLMGALLCLLIAFGVFMVKRPLVEVEHMENEDLGDISTLVEWVEKNGGDVNGVEIYEDEHGDRGIMSNRELEEGEDIAIIPSKLVIDEKTVRNDPTVRKVMEILGDLDEIAEMTVFLLARANDPKWSTYINTLPESPTTPLFWEEEDIKLMQGSMIIEMLSDLEDILSEQFAAVSQVIPHLTLDQYTLTWANVNARIFALDKDGDKVSALLPFIDMVNHDGEPNVAIGYNADLDSVVMSTLSGISANDALSSFYYNASNSYHLFFQGFTLADNDDHLSCEISSGDASCLFETVGENPDFYESFVDCIESLRTTDSTPVNNDKSALALVAESTMTSLKQFPNSIEEDEELLESEDLTDLQINAVRARRDEKLCLKKVRLFSEDVRNAMETGLWDDIDRVVALSPEGTAYIRSLKTVTATTSTTGETIESSIDLI